MRRALVVFVSVCLLSGIAFLSGCSSSSSTPAPQFSVSAAIDPPGSGIVTGTGPVDEGTAATLTAAAAAGYHFSYWEGGAGGTSATNSFTPTGDVTVTAHFAPNWYTVTPAVGSAGGGTVSSPGSYAFGSTATITAVANPGYHLSYWAGGAGGSNAANIFTVTGDAAVTANFAPNWYTVTTEVGPAGGGTVSPSASWAYSTTATITATPGTGYHVDTWDGGAGGSGTTNSFKVTGNVIVTVNFLPNSYTVTTAVGSGNGTVSPTPSATYTYNDLATITATANPGHHFSYWTGGAGGTSTTNKFLVTGDATVTAYFARNWYAVDTAVGVEGGGTVTPSGSYEYFSTATITATPAAGYHFSYWTGAPGGSGATANFTVTMDYSLTAHFAPNWYAVTTGVNIPDSGSVAPWPSASYAYGTQATVQAYPAAGFAFSSWNSLSGPSANPWAFTVTGDRSVTAFFSPIIYTVTVTPSPVGGGTISGTGTFHYGDTTRVQATALSGYEFSGFAGQVTGSANPQVLTVGSDLVASAVFVPAYPVQITVSPAGAGTVSGGGTYRQSHSATLQATALEGYAFSGWEGDLVSTDNPATVSVTGPLAVSAVFRPVPSGWAFMAEPNPDRPSAPGVYGVQGVPDPANHPGGRWSPVGWSDPAGNIWAFGGYGWNYTVGTQFFSDLWKFDPAIGQWASMEAPSSPAEFGTLGVPNPANAPGFRWRACGASDADGNLWLFGGTSGYSSPFYGDLWRYDTATGDWTWMGGDEVPDRYGAYGTLGVPDPGNRPGGRQYPVGWTDAGGNFWTFGGYGYSSASPYQRLNDVWKFDVTLNQWSWEGGSSTGYQAGVYGTPGVSSPGIYPGARWEASGAGDAAGNLWVFGGYGESDTTNGSGYLADLWKFDTTSKEWTFMGGIPAPNLNGVHGTKGISNPANVPGGRQSATAWVDGSGRFWLFGGEGFDGAGGTGPLNDLWMFDPETGEWTWEAGSNSAYDPATYGEVGVVDPSYTPSARRTAPGVTTPDGKLWLFGGNASYNWMGDLWRYSP